MATIKRLTTYFDNGTPDNELRMGVVAMENNCYEQAWKHFVKASKTAKTEYQKGQAYCLLHDVMAEIDDNHPLVQELKKSELDLAKILRENNVGPEYARRYIGRKYLEKSAQHGFYEGMIDYSLLCIGYGYFPYKDELKNIQTGIDWAKIMMSNKNDKAKAIANLIYAKYYYLKRNEEYRENVRVYKGAGSSYSPKTETVNVKEFAKYILKANELFPDNKYIQFYLSQLYCNILFSGYNGGSEYKPDEGRELLKKIERETKDVRLKQEAKDYIKVLETHFSKSK